MGRAEITILGHRYKVKGDYPPEHIEELAQYVNQKIQEVYEKMPNITPLKAVVIASLNIANEMKKTRRDFDSIIKDLRIIEDKTDSFIKLFD
ncbi:MAG TPA: cell division protein ZapA [Nitrospirae bacterium]|nr:cell division protein ZapA [Nitrospirota bacterium]